MIFIQPLAKRSNAKTRQKKAAINKMKRKIMSLNDSETSETEVIKFFFFFYFFI